LQHKEIQVPCKSAEQARGIRASPTSVVHRPSNYRCSVVGNLQEATVITQLFLNNFLDHQKKYSNLYEP